MKSKLFYIMIKLLIYIKLTQCANEKELEFYTLRTSSNAEVGSHAKKACPD